MHGAGDVQNEPIRAAKGGVAGRCIKACVATIRAKADRSKRSQTLIANQKSHAREEVSKRTHFGARLPQLTARPKLLARCQRAATCSNRSIVALHHRV
jgi:hypothetical protein